MTESRRRDRIIGRVAPGFSLIVALLVTSGQLAAAQDMNLYSEIS